MKDKSGTLAVRGMGEIRVAPDEAIIHLRVITEGKSAADAVEQNSKRTQSVIEAVSAQPNHGVTTTGLGVSPIVRYEADTGVPTIVGYRASNGVEVKTKIGYAGKIYDVGIKAGANESSGISFRLQNEAPYREEALGLATRMAFKEAGIVARTANVELLGPEHIEIDAGGQLVYRTAALEAKDVSTPVIPDDLRVRATVSITFRTHG